MKRTGPEEGPAKYKLKRLHDGPHEVSLPTGRVSKGKKKKRKRRAVIVVLLV